MRTLVTIPFAALAGVHCSAPGYSESREDGAGDAVATEEPAPSSLDSEYPGALQ